MSTLSQTKTVDHYEREGYVIVPNVLDENLMAEGRAHVDWLLEKNPDLRPEQLDHHLAKNDAFWLRLVSDERLLAVAEQFIWPDIGLFATHYIAKRPHDGKAVPWHQDGTYWPLEPMEVITFWLSLDRSDEENGCMKVMPGTQDKQLMSEDDYVQQNEEALFERAMDSTSVDEGESVSLILNPGDISIHHPNVIHGSHANTSPRWRRGLTIRYIPTSTRIVKEEPHPAFILRGEGHANGNTWTPLPKYTLESMSFADKVTWDQKVEAENGRNKALFV